MAKQIIYSNNVIDASKFSPGEYVDDLVLLPLGTGRIPIGGKSGPITSKSTGLIATKKDGSTDVYHVAAGTDFKAHQDNEEVSITGPDDNGILEVNSSFEDSDFHTSGLYERALSL